MVDLRELIANTVQETRAGYQDDPTPEDWASARAILAALDAAGMVVVPREPTDEMKEAGELSPNYVIKRRDMAHLDVYRAMISASPYAKKEVE